MSSSVSGANNEPSKGWTQTLAPYVVKPAAASVAIVPVFRDLVAKTSLQKGDPIARMSLMEGLKAGAKAAPTVGFIVGTQMVLEEKVEKAFRGKDKEKSLSSTLAGAAVIGAASSPALAVFNGQTMGWGVNQSLRNLKANPRQALAIAAQETAFVGGLSASDPLGNAMKERFGDSKVVEYSAAFTSGALGSLAGHPANTALTRWQSGLKVDTLRQSMWGAARKARAVGAFSVGYKACKEAFGSTVKADQ